MVKGLLYNLNIVNLCLECWNLNTVSRNSDFTKISPTTELPLTFYFMLLPMFICRTHLTCRTTRNQNFPCQQFPHHHLIKSTVVLMFPPPVPLC